MTTLTISTTDADCGGDSANGLSSSDTQSRFGKTAAGNSIRSWTPFTVNLAQGTTITSATLKVIASTSLSTTTCNAKIGCEAADNPSPPADWAALAALALTTAYLTVSNAPAWTAGTEYTLDVTTAVQEILNRGGFVSGNTIAILMVDNTSSTSARRAFASYDNTTYTEPILEIVYTPPDLTLTPSAVTGKAASTAPLFKYYFTPSAISAAAKSVNPTFAAFYYFTPAAASAKAVTSGGSFLTPTLIHALYRYFKVVAPERNLILHAPYRSFKVTADEDL